MNKYLLEVELIWYEGGWETNREFNSLEEAQKYLKSDTWEFEKPKDYGIFTGGYRLIQIIEEKGDDNE